jgi:hypothetical protein
MHHPKQTTKDVTDSLKKRSSHSTDTQSSKRYHRGEGFGLRRCRDNREAGGRSPLNISGVDFSAIATTRITEERRRHQEEGLCVKCH